MICETTEYCSPKCIGVGYYIPQPARTTVFGNSGGCHTRPTRGAKLFLVILYTFGSAVPSAAKVTSPVAKSKPWIRLRSATLLGAGGVSPNHASARFMVRFLLTFHVSCT